MPATAESLDNRLLLTAVLEIGILTVTGTDSPGGEIIRVWNSSKNPRRLVVGDGTAEFSFSRNLVRLIRINAGAGPDLVLPLIVNGEVDLPMRIEGGAGDDTLHGAIRDDTLIGNGGDDELHGGKGIDLADYSYVVDAFIRGAANRAYGGVLSIDAFANDQTADGIDNIFGDIEQLAGTQFRDSLVGNGRSNTIIGGNGADEIHGAGGDDLLMGDQQLNFITGGSGNDTLLGGRGGNVLNGDGGDDELISGSGDSTMAGGSGNDIYRGGPGIDTASFGGPATLHASFDGQANDGPEGSSDNFIDIDVLNSAGEGDMIDATDLKHGFTYQGSGSAAIVRGSEFDDVLTSDKQATIFGFGGADSIAVSIFGANAIGVIDGGDGNDTITTGGGNDSISGAGGDDSITSGDGNDVINAGSGRDTVRAGNGNDFIRGAKGSDRIDGEAGDDTLRGEAPNDKLIGGMGGDNFLQTEKDAGFVLDFEDGIDVLV